MARPNKMWFRKDRGTWYVRIDGTLHNLGKDKAAAEKQFHKLKLQESPPPACTSAVAIFDAFLAWAKANKAERTFEGYRDHIQDFVDSLGNQSLPADSLRPYHLTQWLKPSWSQTYKRNCIQSVKRAYSWAVEHGYLTASPIAAMKKPMAERREDFPTFDEYKAMLAAATEPFKSLLEFLFEVGCRPQEAIAIEPRHFVNGRIEFWVKESKGKKYARVIYLTDRAKAIIEERIKHLADAGKMVFTNRNGRKWTAFAINCRMRRIAEKTGKHYPAYAIRHARITQWLEAGLDHLTVAKLAGHRDGSMISRVYGHAGEKSDFLQEQLRRAQ